MTHFSIQIILPLTCASFSHCLSPPRCEQDIQFTMFCDMIIKSTAVVGSEASKASSNPEPQMFCL